VSVDVATPSAVLLSIVKSTLGSLFFQSPQDLAFQEDAFTNTTTVATIGTNEIFTTVAIAGGGGHRTFQSAAPLPEPTTLMLLGAGLTLLGLRGRRRRSWQRPTGCEGTPFLKRSDGIVSLARGLVLVKSVYGPTAVIDVFVP
jgi:hypothetical protein